LILSELIVYINPRLLHKSSISPGGKRPALIPFFLDQVLFIIYNDSMAPKNEIIAYRSRWLQVDHFIQKERQSAPLELRWKQLNSAYTMAQDLGLLQPDRDEMKVFQIWADLKEKATNLNRKI
jgi:hypothetical protein